MLNLIDAHFSIVAYTHC